MELVKQHFSTKPYDWVWSGIETAHHSMVQDDLDGSGNITVFKEFQWHKESILEHVQTVSKEARKFDNEDVHLLADLHDVAKPFLRFVDLERMTVRFAGHEYGSALFSVNFLKKHRPDKVLSFLKIISLHVNSFRDNLMEFDLNEEEIELMKMLNLADNRGRISENPVELSFDGWKPVQKTVTESNKEFTFLLGIPGAGKSFYTAKQDGLVFSTDEYMERMAKEIFGDRGNYNQHFALMSENKINWVEKCVNDAVNALKHSDMVILDATNLTKSKRQGIVQRARKAGAKVKFVMFWRDFMDCVNCRKGEKEIPLGVYKRMISSFTYPSVFEYDTLEHVVV